jgi:hypothetical protein
MGWSDTFMDNPEYSHSKTGNRMEEDESVVAICHTHPFYHFFNMVNDNPFCRYCTDEAILRRSQMEC